MILLCPRCITDSAQSLATLVSFVHAERSPRQTKEPEKEIRVNCTAHSWEAKHAYRLRSLSKLKPGLGEMNLQERIVEAPIIRFLFNESSLKISGPGHSVRNLLASTSEASLPQKTPETTNRST